MFGERNEITGHHHATLRVCPTGQRLIAQDTPGLVHHWLVKQDQFLALQTLAQVGFHRRTGRHHRLHGRVKKTQCVATGCLGLVHGQVSTLEQLVDAGQMVVKQRDADAGRAVMLVVSHAVGLVQRSQYLAPNGFRLSCSFVGVGAKFLQKHHEFVSAQARHSVRLPHALAQPNRHLLEQLIAHIVALRVVQVLEVIEINEQQGAG